MKDEKVKFDSLMSLKSYLSDLMNDQAIIAWFTSTTKMTSYQRMKQQQHGPGGEDEALKRQNVRTKRVRESIESKQKRENNNNQGMM